MKHFPITDAFVKLCTDAGLEPINMAQQMMLHAIDECNTKGIGLTVEVQPANGENTAYHVGVYIASNHVPAQMAFRAPELTGWHWAPNGEHDLASLDGNMQLVKAGRWTGTLRQDDDAYFKQTQELMATTGELTKHRITQVFLRLISRFGDRQ